MDDFLIAGGGIAGLAASLGLARIGRASRVCEQAAAFAEVGAGIQMSPNGVRALQWLGAWEAVEPHCVAPAEIHVRDGRSGKFLQRIPLGKNFEQRFGAPYRVAHRADLLAGMLATAQASSRIEIRTGTIIDKPEPNSTLIAADGVNSRLRLLVSPEAKVTTHPHTLHRALIPFAGVPPGIAADCVTLWLCTGGHVVHYPVSNWRHFNIVSTETSFADCAAALADLLASVRSWSQWPTADLEPLKSWSSGNVALIGDAAHAALPYLAQGANMALEDACELATCFAQYPDTALARYEALRKPRTTRVQQRSRRLATLYHAAGVRALARNAALSCMGAGAALSHNEFIYDWRPG